MGSQALGKGLQVPSAGPPWAPELVSPRPGTLPSRLGQEGPPPPPTPTGPKRGQKTTQPSAGPEERVIVTWLVLYGKKKKKKSPCRLLPRQFRSIQAWGLERRRLSDTRRREGRAGALHQWGNRFPPGAPAAPLRRTPLSPLLREVGSPHLSLSHTHTSSNRPQPHRPSPTPSNLPASSCFLRRDTAAARRVGPRCPRRCPRQGCPGKRTRQVGGGQRTKSNG